MVSDALRGVMLAAEGAGELTGPSVTTGAADHPVCGDLVELDFRVEDGRVVDLAWRAEGCPATMAVVAAAPAALRGHRLDEAEQRMGRRLADLGGLAATERHALALFLRALRQAAPR